MMKYSLSLGKFFGIQVQVHWTFLILIIWVIWRNLTSGAGATQTAWSILFLLSVFFCVTLHEFGHALTAKRFGILTRDITLLPIGGLARLDKIPEKPKEELLVALAGPLVNFLLVPLLYPFSQFELHWGNLSQLTAINGDNFVFNLMFINVWLAIFNLIPAFPMDGGRVLRAILSFKMPRNIATRYAATVGQILSIGFVMLGFVSNPFLIFIGFFIFLGAQSEADLTQTQSILGVHQVKEAVMTHFATVQADDPVSSAVEKMMNSQCRNFLVLETEKPVGTLDREMIIKTLSSRSMSTPIREVMHQDISYMPGNLPLSEALTKMQQTPASLVPVMEDGRFLGVIDIENIMEFIMVQEALKKT